MPFHTITKKAEKEYHYLVQNVRTGGKVKQFRAYLGEGKLPKEKLKKLIKNNKQKLDKKILNYLKAHDPLHAVFSENELQALEDVKKDYIVLKKKMHASELENYEEWFTVEYTYDSNRIEGSTLSKEEVSFVLYDTRTPEGKLLREINEASNHKEAYEFIKQYTGGLTLDFILKIHGIVMKNILAPERAGHLRAVDIYIRNAKFTPPAPQHVEPQLRELIDWYKRNQKRYHPAVLAAHFHAVFEQIHPFVDGNGRTGRLLLNYILLKNGYPPVNIESSKKLTYISCLQDAQTNGNLKPFAHMIAHYIFNNSLVRNYRENIKYKK